VVTRFPGDAKTIHRLLRYRPDSHSFGRNADHPINADVIVVDEASMIDLDLFGVLLAAIPEDAKLILLGDKDQLSSVGTGHVFADMSKALLVPARSGSGDVIDDDSSLTRSPAIELSHNYRFAPDSGIGQLASAIRAGEAEEALFILSDGRFGDVGLIAATTDTNDIVDILWPKLSRYMSSDSIREAVDLLGEARFLCGTHAGVLGVDAINRCVNRRFGAREQGGGNVLFDFCPVLVTENDYSVELFNGDIGICYSEQGRMLLWFPDGSGSVRPVAPSRMPSFQTAWAITVHKSQGSEYHHVVLVLPADASPLLTRELIYTGVTRARKRIDIVGSADNIRRAIERTDERASGLKNRLQDVFRGLHPV
jgi:exodeoxyribonuclease V alpha subunit